MYYAIVAIGCFIGGYVTSFFVMRNNPKYFNIDKMAKAKRDELIAKIKPYIDQIKEKR